MSVRTIRIAHEANLTIEDLESPTGPHVAAAGEEPDPGDGVSLRFAPWIIGFVERKLTRLPRLPVTDENEVRMNLQELAKRGEIGWILLAPHGESHSWIDAGRELELLGSNRSFLYVRIQEVYRAAVHIALLPSPVQGVQFSTSVYVVAAGEQSAH